MTHSRKTGPTSASSAGAEAVAATFEVERPRLWRLAYRMLGSVADAEDAVQDTYLRWRDAEHQTIERPAAWLTTACTRRCIDLLRAAHRTRVDYHGPWLPEPVVAQAGTKYSDPVELASSLSTAFLLLLERLTPAERAAYLLHEIFDHDYGEIAPMLGKSEQACRQLVSRARRHVEAAKPRVEIAAERRSALLDGFLEAIKTGAMDRLQGLLAEDVEFWGDGGGKAQAPSEVIRGRADTLAFLVSVWETAWQHLTVTETKLNDDIGILLWSGGQLVAAISLAADADGRIAAIYVLRNPDKLAHLPVSTQSAN